MKKNTNTRNGSISFWKFMFSIMIVIYHVTTVSKGESFVLFPYGSIAVEFFFLVSGYFMTKKAMQQSDDTKNIAEETSQYIWKKIKAFFPYILVAFIISLIVKCITENYTKSQIINSIWQLLFLDMSSIQKTRPLAPVWYISAMLICMLVLYPLIRKYKKNFTHIIAPIIVIFVSGWISHQYGKLTVIFDWTGIMYAGILRAFFELALGAILYEVVEKLKTIDFTKFAKFILKIVELTGFISIFFIANIANVSTNYDFIMLLILCVSISIALSEKTIGYNLANNSFCYYLEKLSLPIYLNHVWIRIIVQNYFKQITYIQKVGLVVILSITVSIIILFFIEKGRKIKWEKQKMSS